MITFNQNASKLAHTSRFKRFILGSCVLLLLFFALPVFALLECGSDETTEFFKTDFNDNFDSYNAGALAPQSVHWRNGGNIPSDIEICYSGKCAYADSNGPIHDLYGLYVGSCGVSSGWSGYKIKTLLHSVGTGSNVDFRNGLYNITDDISLSADFDFYGISTSLKIVLEDPINCENLSDEGATKEYVFSPGSLNTWFELTWAFNTNESYGKIKLENLVDNEKIEWCFHPKNDVEMLDSYAVLTGSLLPLIYDNTGGGNFFIDDISYYEEEIIVSDLPNVYFDSPADNSEIDYKPLEIEASWENWNSEDFNQLGLIGFNTETEKTISKWIYNTENSGSHIFEISEGLNKGNWKFYFRIADFTAPTGSWQEYNTENKDVLNLKILIDYPDVAFPEIPMFLPVDEDLADPDFFYSENSSYPTSTPLYNILTGTFGSALIYINNFLDVFDYFKLNKDEAGILFGNSIRSGRSYLGNINAFFSDFPITQLLFLYLICLMIILVFRIIKFIRVLLPF